MADNELTGTQAQPEGEAVANPETVIPENTNELDTDNGEGNEGQGSDEGQQGDAAGNPEEPQEHEKPKQQKKPLSWEMKRIHEETNRRREAERELERIREENERLRKGTTAETPDTAQVPDIDTIANQRAQQIADQREFEKKIQAWDAAGTKEFGKDDFYQSCNIIASLMDDRQQAMFMKTITDSEIVEDGHKVVMALADDPEEAERILKLPPVKQALALTKLSEKLKQPAAKPVSKVPPPVAPVTGTPKVGTRLDDPDTPMDKWADDFLKSVKR